MSIWLDVARIRLEYLHYRCDLHHKEAERERKIDFVLRKSMHFSFSKRLCWKDENRQSR